MSDNLSQIVDINTRTPYKILGRFDGHREIKGFVLSAQWGDEQKRNLLAKYKIFISKADGAAGQLGNPIPAKIIGTPELGLPNMLCTETFLAIGPFDIKQEAIHSMMYMKTLFFRLMVSIRKNKNMTRDTYKFVPMQDFTDKSDIDWSKPIEEIDKQLYKKYGLTQKEIDFVETMIKPME